jgi:antitoxin FitA
MSVSMTLKNIPDVVYERLKISAESNRRSMNSEAIVCLENALLPSKLKTADRLMRARALRKELPIGKFKAQTISALKRAGRK